MLLKSYDADMGVGNLAFITHGWECYWPWPAPPTRFGIDFVGTSANWFDWVGDYGQLWGICPYGSWYNIAWSEDSFIGNLESNLPKSRWWVTRHSWFHR